ncbi:MAG: hypothetical protein AB2L11_13810 [Syntrophobacteraceae bacterium]
MSKKRVVKSNIGPEAELLPEEVQELGMIVDRLSVQTPNGGSLGSYLESLRNVLGNREKMVAALIEALAKRPTEVGFQAFLKLQDIIEAKEYAKLRKQAIYRFAQRGFLKPPEGTHERKVVLVQKETKKSLAHLVPMGESFWFLSSIIHEENRRDATAVSAYVAGTPKRVILRVGETSNRAYKEYIQRVSEHLPRKPVEIPLWHAAGLIREMIEFFGSEGDPVQAEGVKRAIQPFDDPQRLSYAYELMPELEHPEELLREIDLQVFMKNLPKDWIPFSKEDLLPTWEKLRELERPVLVIPKEMQEARSLDLLKNAANDLCSGKTRFIFQRFFEEEALWHKLSGREEIAMWAWIVAQHLRGAANAGENPVIAKLLALSFVLHWPEDLKSKEPEAEDLDQYHKTDSGIFIVPG